jgi:hypothetical protein
MTRTERIPPNPNHFVGNHPLINSDQLDQYYPEPEDSRPAFPSAFNDASFHKGTVHFQSCPFSRKSLERAIQQISAAELAGGEHLIGYLQDQYRHTNNLPLSILANSNPHRLKSTICSTRSEANPISRQHVVIKSPCYARLFSIYLTCVKASYYQIVFFTGILFMHGANPSPQTLKR